MKVKQKYLGKTGSIALLVFISAFPPLSTDLYLPAFPEMLVALKTSQSHVSMTLSLFFAFFAAGLLFWGPLSEKYGRKPILIIGLAIYTISSILCGLAQNVSQLICFRILQAFGGSAATAVATAIVKDLFSGRERERVLAIIMSLVIIAPIIAPVLGAFLLEYTSWRALFYILGGAGIIAALAFPFLEETLIDRYTGSTVTSWGRLFTVLKNPGFSWLLTVFSAIPMPIMAFLAASSFIYIEDFGLSEKQFSYFLALNGVAAMLGPPIYIKASKRFNTQVLIFLSFSILCLSGFGILLAGSYSPWLLSLFMALGTVAITAMRVSSTNLMLEQQEKDAGSASALINFFGMIMGSLGMLIVSINPNYLIATIGSTSLIIGLIGGLLWLMIRKRSFIQLTHQKVQNS